MKLGYANVDPTVLGPMVNAGQYAEAYAYGLAVGYSPDDLANWLNATYGTGYTGASLAATMAPAPAPTPSYPPTIVYNIDGAASTLDGSRYRWTHLYSGGAVLYDYATGQSLQGWYETPADAANAKGSLMVALSSNATIGGGMTVPEQHAIIASQLENPNSLPSSLSSNPGYLTIPEAKEIFPVTGALQLIGQTKPAKVQNDSASGLLKLALIAGAMLFS